MTAPLQGVPGFSPAAAPAAGAVPPAAPANQPAPQPAQVQQVPSVQYDLSQVPALQTQQPAPAAPATPAPAPAPATQPAPMSADMLTQVIRPGPGVPPELVGRTLGQAFTIYNGLAQQYVRNMQGGTAPAPQQAATPPQQPTQPTQQPTRSFWANPQESIAQIVKQEVAAATQQIALPQQIQAARASVAALPAYAQHAAAIDAKIAALPPEMQAKPEAWQTALKLAVGEAALSGTPAAAPQPQQPQQFGFPQLNSPGFVAPQFGFTEVPGQNVAPQLQPLSAEEQHVMRNFNMTEEQYRAWKGGVAR